MADKAFLVGINRYPGAPLAGCVNDVMDMADFLVKNCRFNSTNIRLLTDSRATTANILARLEWLVSDLKAGDRILFHYSGHGAQVPTRSDKGEVDGLDEAICPVDFNWEKSRMIRDDQFNQIFSRIPAGVTAVWISDSCHSGDLSRSIGGPGGLKAKTLPMPEDIQWRLRALEENKVPPKVSSVKTGALPIALISGCQDNQTSADAKFRRRPNGALTYMLLQALHAYPNMPLNQLIEKVRASLRGAGFSQNPQLEGASDQLAKAFLKT